jgi:hypothetical protein
MDSLEEKPAIIIDLAHCWLTADGNHIHPHTRLARIVLRIKSWPLNVNFAKLTGIS